jgi:hydroxyacylglutathione hydrolase
MKIQTLTVGPVGCNCNIVACPETGEAVIIDPGGNPERILAAVKAMGVHVKLLLHTHGHFDHILATGEVAKEVGGAILLHRNDRELYDLLPEQCRYFGFRAMRPPTPTRLLHGGESLPIGKLTAQVLHTPGHTPGSVGYYFGPEESVLFSGDTLFSKSIGRTDLEGGSLEDLVTSIQTKLYTLPVDTRVIPGHGFETTIGYERENNPFVTADLSSR